MSNVTGFTVFAIFRSIILAATSSSMMTRRVWCRPRSTEWWKAVCDGLFGEDWWRDNLRMKRDTFTIICNLIRPHIEKQVHRLLLLYCSRYH